MSDLTKMQPTQAAVTITTKAGGATEGGGGPRTQLILAARRSANDLGDTVAKAVKVASFDGTFAKHVEILAPADSEFERIVVLGRGDPKELAADHWARLGGAAYAALKKAGRAEVDLSRAAPDELRDFLAGALLRSYRFDRYRTKKEAPPQLELTVVVKDEAKGSQALEAARAIADGVFLARDLVNEPANVLTPKTFAKRVTKQLEKLDANCTTLKRGHMKKLGMRALLGVSRGSRNPPRMAIIEWNGGKKGDKPIAFVGKGVTFDTGGISIKPSASMEDMKGDMGGAAAVAGLMATLAARKARVNVVGVIAMVENMPDGDAQRPGDIVEAMSGTTIEIINTDAEGRLVLADAMWHVQEQYQPKAMIDLATLTGAILVALGHHRAGMYANDDALADALLAAGNETEELVWRMPMGDAYDKLIVSKNADIKNTGGRMAGSITAAQFLARFVQDGVAWSHLDVAGTAMGSPASDVNESWGSGFGVRLLNEYVRAQEG